MTDPRVDRGEESLTRRVAYQRTDLVDYSPVTERYVGDPGMSMGDLCDAAVTVSDNTAANLMLASFGGPAGLTSFVRSLGDETTRLDRIETELNEALPGDPRLGIGLAARAQAQFGHALVQPAGGARALSHGRAPERPGSARINCS